jgi:segregation and condensation protein B
MNQEQLKNIIEAALMVSDKPMSINRLLELFQKDVEEIEREEIMAAIQELQDDYQTRGIELAKVANGYRIQSRAEYADWVNRLFDEKPPRYSRALLETLAIIAYRQPLTRAEIEDIRGVSVSSNIIKTLQEREWIRVVGHKDLPGKPELLATTKEFLDYFNLKTLSELPTLAEIKELNQLNPDLFASLESTPDFAAEGQHVTDIDESEDESDADDDGFLDEGKVVPFSNA